MLVLLVTFIITAPTLTNTIHVNFPDTRPTLAAKEPIKRVVISVEGRIYVNKEEFSIEALESQLILLNIKIDKLIAIAKCKCC